MRKADRHAFHRGDFVSVLATVDISSRLVFNRKKVRATFKVVQVIRLASSTLVKELFPSLPVPGEDVEMQKEGYEGRTRIALSLDPSLQ